MECLIQNISFYFTGLQQILEVRSTNERFEEKLTSVGKSLSELQDGPSVMEKKKTKRQSPSPELRVSIDPLQFMLLS